MNKFEHEGYWWLPEKPDKKIAGSLRFDPVEGAVLELIGSFKDLTKLGDVSNPDFVLGVAGGKAFTLYKCVETNTRMNMNVGLPVTMVSTYFANVIFVGYHFAKEEDIVFESITVNYSYLEQWVGISGIKFGFGTDKDKHLTKYDASYSFPEKITIRPGDFDLTITYAFRDGGDRLKHLEFVQTTLLEIKPKTPLSFDEYHRKFLYHLQNLLSLGVGRAVYPLEIKGKNSNCKTDLDKGKSILNEIVICYRLGKLPDLKKKLHPLLDMFFCYSDISSHFENCIRNWFAKADLLSPVYDLYFATLYNPAMYLQHEFLSLAQAIESYHRRVVGGEYVNREGYAPILKALTEAIPDGIEEGFRKSLEYRMQYLHEYSLMKRLKDLTNINNAVLVSGIKDKGVFVKDVCNTRNFLTHYDKDLEDKAKKGNDLYKITKQLQFLIEICLLKELGIPDSDILKLTLRNQRYTHIQKL